MSVAARIMVLTEGSASVGFGHVRRCLSLALALRARDVSCVFALRGDAAVASLIEDAGFPAVPLNSGDPVDAISSLPQALAIIVDSYSVSTRQLESLRTKVPFVAVIDDLADRPLPVSMVINGSATAASLPYIRYPSTDYLLGPQFALLRPEFRELPVREIAPVRHLLVTVGGGDPHDWTSRFVRWSRAALPDVIVDVVWGPLFPPLHKTGVIEDDRCIIHRSPPNIRALMTLADMAVTGGGQTTYELAATGTPAVAIAIASNQRASLEALGALGVLVYAGDTDTAGLGTIATQSIADLSRDDLQRNRMSLAGRSLVDGEGIFRVADRLRQKLEARA